MSKIASLIPSLTIVYSTVYSRRKSKKTSKLRVTGLCEGNSPVTGEFSAQRASNVENVSIWWRHHEMIAILLERHNSHLFHSRPSFNCDLNKRPLALIHGWAITYHNFRLIWLIFHTLISQERHEFIQSVSVAELLKDNKRLHRKTSIK